MASDIKNKLYGYHSKFVVSQDYDVMQINKMIPCHLCNCDIAVRHWKPLEIFFFVKTINQD